jgi:glyoxylase-like metal-dependent hydrolase (beta-lactamase superfamily II)
MCVLSSAATPNASCPACAPADLKETTDMDRRTLFAASAYAAGSLAIVGTAGVTALAALGTRPARAQGQDFSKVDVQATSLSANVYMLTGAGGNEAFGREGALIVAHDNVRRRLASEQLIALAGSTNRQPPTAKPGLPVVTVAGELTFHINGDEVHTFHVPRAHTDGDLVVHFRKSDVVHMGDTYFNGFYPFIDVGSGGTAEGVVAAADRVLALAGDKTKIIPGHGPLASKADLQVYRDMLAAAVQRVKAARAAGKSDDEFRNSKPFADLDERYGKGFINPQVFVAMMLAAVPR